MTTGNTDKAAQIHVNSSFNISLNKNVKKSVLFQFLCCQFSNDHRVSAAAAPASNHSAYVCFKCQSPTNVCARVKNSRYLKSSYYKNNLAYYLFVLMYVLVLILLVIIQAQVYKNENVAIQIARGAGILISFNMVLVLILVMRGIITWLRSTNIGRKCLPSDEFLDFHKYIGVAIMVLSIVHTIGHCVNLCQSSFGSYLVLTSLKLAYCLFS